MPGEAAKLRFPTQWRTSGDNSVGGVPAAGPPLTTPALASAGLGVVVAACPGPLGADGGTKTGSANAKMKGR